MKYCLAPARPKPVIYDVRVERERGLFSFSPVGEIIFKKKLNIADFFVANSKVSPKRPSGGHSQPMLTLLMEQEFTAQSYPSEKIKYRDVAISNFF